MSVHHKECLLMSEICVLSLYDKVSNNLNKAQLSEVDSMQSKTVRLTI